MWSAHYTGVHVRIIGLLVLASVLVGSGGCRRPDERTARDQDKPRAELPPSAKPVEPPTLGIATPTPVVVPPHAPGVPPGAPASFAPLVKNAGDAVVTIVIKVRSKRGPRSFMKGLGSGFLIDKDGLVLTNNHVVQGGNALEVVLRDDKTVEGRVLGTDPMTDIAVIRIDKEAASGITPIPLGDSDSVQVGDWVVAIGNPLGLSHSVTAGILSARGRTNKDVPLQPQAGGEAYFDFLQTDAAINPGNSGGPLLNLNGEAIGINTAINAAGQGLAFAIPINMVKLMIPSLVKEGKLVRSYLGVGIEDAPMDDKLGTRGALVTRVYRGTPAEKAGIRPGDHVLAVSGQPVRDSSQLRWLVSISGVGRDITLRLVRDSKAFDLPVKLERLPERRPPAPGVDEEDDDEEFLPPVRPVP